MKKPVLSIDEPAPKKKSLRADRPPTEGFTVVVDGHFKSDFETLDGAEASGRKLKSTYPMLKIEIYDAATRVRALLSWETLLAVGNRHRREQKNGSPKTRNISSGKRTWVTRADRCTLVFDTDAKNLYVEREVTRLDTSVDGTIEIQTATMDIADYLKQGGQTAGHPELWRLLRTFFKDTDHTEELID
jgi:hypothetical protein